MTAVAETIGIKSVATGTSAESSLVYEPAALKVIKKQITGKRSKKAFTAIFLLSSTH